MKFKFEVILAACLTLCFLSGCALQNNAEKSSINTISSEIASSGKTEISETAESEEEWEMNILEDPERGLIIEEDDEESIQQLMRLVQAEASASSLGHEVSFEDVLEYVSIPQLRPITLDGSYEGLIFYSAHDSSSGGRMFLFYCRGREVDYNAIYCFFVKKSVLFEDFDTLEEEISTLEDVEKIDPGAKFNFFNIDDDPVNYHVRSLETGALGESPYFSAHATKEGIVNIGYRKSGNQFIVEKIDKMENLVIDSNIYDPVAAINENDWP